MTEPTPDAPATGTDPVTPDADANQTKPTDTVEFWKTKAREQETRAKANAKAAERLAEIEEASKTEAQKTAERLAAAETDVAAARAEALRLRIASRFQIGDDDADLFLTGSDEATLIKQAERLTARDTERKKTGNHVPREGATTTSVDSDERQVVNALFNG